eukprot:6457238-Amphidinium_carterae.1
MTLVAVPQLQLLTAKEQGESFAQRTCPFIATNFDLHPPWDGIMNKSTRYKVALGLHDPFLTGTQYW